MPAFNFSFLQQDLLLLPEKAIYWKNKKLLLLADAHLGKVGHFRKAGIPVPQDAVYKDYEILTAIIKEYDVASLYILGDFFHSDYNKELELFSEWKQKHTQLDILLIRGNHDVLPDAFYERVNVKVVEGHLVAEPFILSHKPLVKESHLYNIAGHIHPGIRLIGKAYQQLTLPCFYFGERQALLPAFGGFTGHVKIQPQKGDHIFAVVNEQVCQIGN